MSAATPRPDLAALAVSLEAVVRDAGVIAADFFRRGARRWEKADASPVTEGDIAVDAFLHERLPNLLPGSGWLSEETADTPERLARDFVWVVDPIDGTRAFAEGVPMWVISVALVSNGRPVLAAILNPIADEYFSATAGEGAWLNGARLTARKPPRLSAATISGPSATVDLIKGLELPRAPWVYALAYRLVHVAAARFDIAMARRNPKDWDIAAADLVLVESGALLTDLAGNVPVYNRPEVKHPALIAAERTIHAPLIAAIAQSTASSETKE